MLSGMGVPDVRGSIGTSTYYTSSPDVTQREGERVVHVTSQGPVHRMSLGGPMNPKTRSSTEWQFVIETAPGKVVIRSDGRPSELDLRVGQWSDWLRVKFKLGLLQSVRGMVRFHLIATEPLQLYASAINYDPESPPFPLSSPAGYAAELADRIGLFHTAGMPEDHNAMVNQRIDEAAFLQQCELVLREREAMLFGELDRFDEGLFFCLIDTPDRVQHMFWRFLEPQHPAIDCTPKRLTRA